MNGFTFTSRFYRNVEDFRRVVIENPALINAQRNNGDSRLHIDARLGQFDHVNILLEAGSQMLDVANEEGNTPLHLAAKSGKKEVIELLLQHGTQSINRLNYDGYSPLHLAAATSSVKSVLTLVRYGASLRLDDINMLMPMVIQGGARMLSLILDLCSPKERMQLLNLKYDRIPDRDLGLYFRLMEDSRYPGPFLTVLKKHHCPNAIQICSFGQTVIHIGACMNYIHFHPLILATRGYHMDLADKNGDTPIRLACCNDERKNVRLLRALGATSHLTMSEEQLDDLFPEYLDADFDIEIGRRRNQKLRRSIYDPISDERILRWRFEVYFTTSLTEMLLWPSAFPN